MKRTSDRQRHHSGASRLGQFNHLLARGIIAREDEVTRAQIVGNLDMTKLSRLITNLLDLFQAEHQHADHAGWRRVGGILHRESEDLVAVKYMVNQGSIQQIDTIGTTYFLLMFERHEFVAANGFWSECFHPGDWSLGARGNAQRTEIFEIFPDVAATMRRREERVANRRRVRKGAFRVMYGKTTRELPDLAM